MPDCNEAPSSGQSQAREDDDLARLLTDVPALANLDNPWTLDGLAIIEDTALERLDTEAEPTADELALFSLLARGVDHTYLRVLGAGKWVWARTGPDTDPGPVLQLPELTEWIDPEESLGAAMHYRERGWLAEQVSGILSFQEWARRKGQHRVIGARPTTYRRVGMSGQENPPRNLLIASPAPTTA